jgi:hypothetical protein
MEGGGQNKSAGVIIHGAATSTQRITEWGQGGGAHEIEEWEGGMG